MEGGGGGAGGGGVVEGGCEGGWRSGGGVRDGGWSRGWGRYLETGNKTLSRICNKNPLHKKLIFGVLFAWSAWASRCCVARSKRSGGSRTPTSVPDCGT